MKKQIHPDFKKYLSLKDIGLQKLYIELRKLVIEIYPDGNELLYHTHALTSVYSTSLKLSDAYCHIPIYKEHLNIGFNFGTSINDPKGILNGTGKLIRHVPITDMAQLESKDLKNLIADAVAYSMTHQKSASSHQRQVISKIKK
jgi:hypothetical protein